MAALAAHAFQFQSKADVLTYCAPGQERGILKDIRDSLARILRGHAIDADRSRCRQGEAGDEFEYRGFTASRRTDDADEFVLLDG